MPSHTPARRSPRLNQRSPAPTAPPRPHPIALEKLEDRFMLSCPAPAIDVSGLSAGQTQAIISVLGTETGVQVAGLSLLTQAAHSLANGRPVVDNAFATVDAEVGNINALIATTSREALSGLLNRSAYNQALGELGSYTGQILIQNKRLAPGTNYQFLPAFHNLEIATENALRIDDAVTRSNSLTGRYSYALVEVDDALNELQSRPLTVVGADLACGASAPRVAVDFLSLSNAAIQVSTIQITSDVADLRESNLDLALSQDLRSLNLATQGYRVTLSSLPGAPGAPGAPGLPGLPGQLGVAGRPY